LVDAQGARAAADAMDQLRAAQAAPSPFAGIPISVKDLFDVQGQVTTAGSKLLAGAAPATEDAVAVARLRRAGFVVLGRANMTEFAYSGLGLNPHYGTPLNPWDREVGRAPGGSSSGGAVSVALAMAHASLGTDTGGSCRIPAAFMGLTGFKPTATKVPSTGAIPLSPALDAIGPIARSVRCCAALDAVLADEPLHLSSAPVVRGLRFVVPTTVALDTLDAEVAQAFERALGRLSKAGAYIQEAAFPEFDDIARLNAKGGFTAAESYAWHRGYIATSRDQYDPRVISRIERGAHQTAADYLDLIAGRAALISAAQLRMAHYDGLLMPSVAIIAPRMADLMDDSDYARLNLLALRNATIINMIDGCAVSIPVHEQGEAPVGLMLCGTHGNDRKVLALGCALEDYLGA
ncbi:MAG TPA: amidase, partial [Eoetvoesiella sp.]